MSREPSLRRDRRRRGPRLAAVGLLIVAFGAAAAVAIVLLIRGSGPSPEKAANDFLAAWSRADDRGASAMTDNPEAAAASFDANRRGLDGAKLRARLVDVRE